MAYLAPIPIRHAFYSAMLYHRIRIEHRWTQGFADDSNYIFRNRWRYMFRAKIPLNNTKLSPKTLYVSPEAELIMQSGKEVVASPMEDLRLTTTIGYIVNPRLTFAAGVLYSQDKSDITVVIIIRGGRYDSTCTSLPTLEGLKTSCPTSIWPIDSYLC